MEDGTEEEGGEGFVRCTCNPTSDVALRDKGTGAQKRANGEKKEPKRKRRRR